MEQYYCIAQYPKTAAFADFTTAYLFQPPEYNSFDSVHVGRGGTHLFYVPLHPGKMRDSYRAVFFSQLREQGPWTRKLERDERQRLPHDPLRPSSLRYELYPSNERGKPWCTGIVKVPHFEVLYREPSQKSPMVEKRSTSFHYASYVCRQNFEARNRRDELNVPLKSISWHSWGNRTTAETVLQAEKKRKIRELRTPSQGVATEISSLFDKIALLVAITRTQTQHVKLYERPEDSWGMPEDSSWNEELDEQAAYDSQSLCAETDEESPLSPPEDLPLVDLVAGTWDTMEQVIHWKEDDGMDDAKTEEAKLEVNMVINPCVENGLVQW